MANTPPVNMRIAADLLDAARRSLGLPSGTPTAQVVRASLRRIATGDEGADGQPENRGGRRPRALART
jgi:hypothetical protein